MKLNVKQYEILVEALVNQIDNNDYTISALNERITRQTNIINELRADKKKVSEILKDCHLGDLSEQELKELRIALDEIPF